ncbi:hypothetical protein BDW66DRAFT_131178 [Aspergillus desertorum]
MGPCPKQGALLCLHGGSRSFGDSLTRCAEDQVATQRLLHVDKLMGRLGVLRLCVLISGETRPLAHGEFHRAELH